MSSYENYIAELYLKTKSISNYVDSIPQGKIKLSITKTGYTAGECIYYETVVYNKTGYRIRCIDKFFVCDCEIEKI